SLTELGPKLRHRPVEVNRVLLQHMEDTSAAKSLGGRPNEDERVGAPWFFAADIAKSAVKIDNRLPVLPDRNCGSELSKLFKILPEQRLQSLVKLAAFQLHCR